MQSRRVLRVVAVIALLCLAGAGVEIVVSGTHATGDQPPSFYLDVGASASLGVQPNGVVGHNGEFTRWGYGDDVVRLEAAKGLSVTLTKVGCMGETAQSMAGAGDHCYQLPATQLTTAVDFLRAHRNDAGIVSVDVGFNDIRPCLWVVPIAGQCANQGIASVRRDLPGILRTLRASAGPQVRFVGLTYADPFLYRYVKGGEGPALARESLTYMTQLDDVLTAAYRAAGFSVADVSAAFKSSDTSMAALAPYGKVPENVVQVCQHTWMCAAHPFGPDDHPNKSGYMIIAQTILDAATGQS